MKIDHIEEIENFIREFAKLNLLLVQEYCQDTRKAKAELLKELRENARFLQEVSRNLAG